MIKCEGLRENNLKNITVSFPENKIIAVVGVSGSGKSSFAFNSVYAESQRVFFSLMFPQASDLQMKCPCPDLDRISPILPAASMKQSKNNFNPRSTIGTYTGLSNILRTLFSTILNRTQSNFISPSMFSPNTSVGACPKCKGLGYIASPDLTKIIDFQKSIESGSIKIWEGKANVNYYKSILIAACHQLGIDITIPLYLQKNEKVQNLLEIQPALILEIQYRSLKGAKRSKKVRFSGVLHEIKDYAEKHSTTEILNGGYRNYFLKTVCPYCNGKKIRLETEQWKLGGLDFASVEKLSLRQLSRWLSNVSNSFATEVQVQHIITLISSQIEALNRCNLDYLCLERSIPSLSGGEYQRLRLSVALSTKLSSMLFVFDEPSAGLHPKDIEHMVSLMQELKFNHNTILIVEHNPLIIKQSDYVIELGPAAGEYGGCITFSGTSDLFLKTNHPYSLTDAPKGLSISSVTAFSNKYIELRNLSKNNVTIDALKIPQNALITLVGVSGSGKSSLLHAIYENFTSEENIHILNQQPIGKNSRSTIATYLGILDDIRKIFANENPDVPPQIFSYTSKIGRCPCCKGTGVQSFDFDFPIDDGAICPECHGARYNPKAESYLFREKSISQILNMSVDSLLDFFSDIPSITQKLYPLKKIGLGYIHIGQSSNTLSGGESQRVKLGKVLQKNTHTGTFYLLDEPTAGLHAQDITCLIHTFYELKAQGATILLAEHNVQMIRASDYIVELGIGGGEYGGKIIALGSPSTIKQYPSSMIGKYL